MGRGPGQLSRYSDSLRAGRFGDRIPMGARFSTPVQTGLGAYPASYTMCIGSFPGEKRQGRGVDHSPPLALRLKKEQSYTSTPPRGLRGLFQGELFTFTFYGGAYAGQFLMVSVSFINHYTNCTNICFPQCTKTCHKNNMISTHVQIFTVLLIRNFTADLFFEAKKTRLTVSFGGTSVPLFSDVIYRPRDDPGGHAV